jgi:hypothetical protein
MSGITGLKSVASPLARTLLAVAIGTGNRECGSRKTAGLPNEFGCPPP